MRVFVRSSSMVRGSLLGFVLVTGLGATALLLAGASDRRATAFSLDVPSARVVLSLSPGRTACQKPVPLTADVGGLELFYEPSPPAGPSLRVAVADGGTGGGVATGVAALDASGSARARLDRSVPAGRRVSICLTNTGRRVALLTGSGAAPGSGTIMMNGKPTSLAMSVVFLRPHSRSLLNMLPTSFRRAALYRPNWVGAWTYWLLLGLVIVAFLVAGAAVALAARSDAEPD